MFKVELYSEDRSWYGLNFEFDSMEEAQKFVQTALAHFQKQGDGEDENEEAVLIASIRYSQKFTTTKEEENDGQANH